MVKGLTKRLLAWLVTKPKAELVWHCQHATYLAPGDALYHIAASPLGYFEIFETDGNFLLDFPRSLKLPAELFDNLVDAKSRAALAKEPS